MSVEIAPLPHSLGAEVRGLDLRKPLPDAARASLLDAWRERHLLLVRGQALDERAQIDFVANFGSVGDESLQGEGGASYVSNTRPDGFARRGELWFHSDLAFTPDPLHVLSMYALELPASGTSTLFADALLAARTLPAGLRERAAGLEARHLFDLVSQRQDLRYRLADFPGAACAVHPVLWPHPETSEPVLYVSQMQTDCILGLPEAEAEELLGALLAHLYRPEHLYAHEWRPGDLLVWDNWALQHARPPFDESQPRTLRRVVAGGKVVRAYQYLH